MFRSDELDLIGREFGTDKCAGENTHDYLRKYEFFFRPLKDEEFTFLELGIFRGASLRAWERYFPKARIVGVDCEEVTRGEAGGRVEVIIGNLAETPFLETLTSLGARVIIDDASHWWPDQLRSLFVLYKTLPAGGIYIVEDVHTSFQPLAPMFSCGLEIPPPFAVLLKIAEYMTGNGKKAPIVKDKILLPLSFEKNFHAEVKYIADATDAITFIERAVILVKK
jgi:hypothetical protein